jgi:hypothetical protein
MLAASFVKCSLLRKCLWSADKLDDSEIFADPLGEVVFEGADVLVSGSWNLTVMAEIK